MSQDTEYQNVKADFKLIGWTFLESIFYVSFYLFGSFMFPMPYMK